MFRCHRLNRAVRVNSHTTYREDNWEIQEHKLKTSSLDKECYQKFFRPIYPIIYRQSLIPPLGDLIRLDLIQFAQHSTD